MQKLHKAAGQSPSADCAVLQRAKKLNIITAPEKAEALHVRPSNASYLIPAAPQDGSAACNSVPGSSQRPYGTDAPVSDSLKSATAAAPAACEPSAAASPQPQAVSVSQDAQHASVSMEIPPIVVPDRQPVLLQEPTSAASTVQGDLLQQTASRSKSGAVAAPTTELTCPHAHAPPPSKTERSPERGGDRQPWRQLPSQTRPAPSWSRDTSRLPSNWSHSSAQAFGQGKLACTPTFPFSTQACAVMW